MPEYMKLGILDLTNRVYGGFNFFGGQWEIKQDGARSLKTGARKDVPDGTYVRFNVYFKTDAEMHTFMQYVAGKDEDANIQLWVRTSDWYFKVWGIQVLQLPTSQENPMDWMLYGYQVTCYLYSPWTYSNNPLHWVPSSPATLPQTYSSLNNSDGHYNSSFDDLIIQCFYDSAHVKALAAAIASGGSIKITDEALSDEIFELLANDKRLLETYEDLFLSSTKMTQDSTGTANFSTDHMRIDDGEYQIYKLSGPINVRYPIKMTANFAIDAGGATNKAYVDISPDGEAWTTVIDSRMFLLGQDNVYYLNGSEYMKDVYVRFRSDTGTAGKYFKIYHLKFEVERWVPAGSAPVLAVNEIQPMTISCDENFSKKVAIDCTYRPVRLWS